MDREIREEIDEDVALELCLYCKKHDEDPCDVEQPCKAALVTAKTIRETYHSRGCVIKVDTKVRGKLVNALWDAVTEIKDTDECHAEVQKILKEAGLAATESLVEGK